MIQMPDDSFRTRNSFIFVHVCKIYKSTKDNIIVLTVIDSLQVNSNFLCKNSFVRFFFISMEKLYSADF